MSTYHTPIMVAEVLDGLNVEAGKRYIDATVGGAGHTVEIVSRGGRVLGLDADADAIASARERLTNELPEKKEGYDWILVQRNFREIARTAKEQEFGDVSGVLMDLGVSSYQLDTEHKGFSYRFSEAPLDMRFDQTKGMSAAEYINSASREELYEIFTKYGEEERAGAIVHALVLARQVKKFRSVGDVVTAIKNGVGDNRETSGVLSRIFQALRMQLNDEMAALHEGLEGAQQVLGRGGRLAVISFHSLEDRVVKQFMRGSGFGQVTKKPVVADSREQVINRRSRSAKLRIAEKI